MLKAAIEYKILPRIVVQSPQVAHSIAREKGLREMPYFAGDSELLPQRMRHRKGLPKLGPANRAVDDFVEDIVGVVVEAFYVRTEQNQRRVPEAADIEVGSVSRVNSTVVTQGNRRLCALSVVDNSLDPEVHVS